MGFLHSTVKDQPQSRLERWREAGADLGLPELDPGEYMPGLMFEIGPVRWAGEQYQPTDWNIIAPFGAAMGLESDDMLTLAQMCRGYFEAWREGENPLCIPPCDRHHEDEDGPDAIC